MPAIQASRRLVKSPPELWAEVSDAASLARHLGEVGEIRITRLEPETTVAWEGEHASGTVELAPAGWGTSVTLTAEPVAAAEPEQPAAAEPEPAVAESEPAEPQPPAPEAIAEPESDPEPPAEPEATVIEERLEAEPEPTRRGWLARLFKRRAKKPTPTTEPQPSTADADRAGGGEDARPAAEARTGAHPEGHRRQSRWSGPARSAAEPEAEEPAPAPEPVHDPDPLETALTNALDSLGQAHHRPFSRG
jgi:hypothetical protein